VPGRIQVTEEIHQQLEDRYLFEERGLIPVKGRGDMLVYFLIGRKARGEISK
jgi:class 3 adenylate cyclase